MNKTGLEKFLDVSVNYPEINIIKYEYSNDLLIIEVALNRELDETEKERFISKAQGCIMLLHKANRTITETFNIRFRSIAGLTFLRYYRDAGTVQENEINLLMDLLWKEFYDCLLNDNDVTVQPAFKKQVKHDLLKKLDAGNTAYLFAYRDHGRLCMFNR